jgi:hypothetical protein
MSETTTIDLSQLAPPELVDRWTMKRSVPNWSPT